MRSTLFLPFGEVLVALALPTVQAEADSPEGHLSRLGDLHSSGSKASATLEAAGLPLAKGDSLSGLLRRSNGNEDYLRRQRSRRIEERRRKIQRGIQQEEAECAIRGQQRCLRSDGRRELSWGAEDEDETLFCYSGITPKAQLRDLDAISIEDGMRHNLCIRLIVLRFSLFCGLFAAFGIARSSALAVRTSY